MTKSPSCSVIAVHSSFVRHSSVILLVTRPARRPRRSSAGAASNAPVGPARRPHRIRSGPSRVAAAVDRSRRAPEERVAERGGDQQDQLRQASDDGRPTVRTVIRIPTGPAATAVPEPQETVQKLMYTTSSAIHCTNTKATEPIAGRPAHTRRNAAAVRTCSCTSAESPRTRRPFPPCSRRPTSAASRRASRRTRRPPAGCRAGRRSTRARPTGLPHRIAATTRRGSSTRR